MADVSAYDPKKLLVILFNHMANFLSVGSAWRFDSVQISDQAVPIPTDYLGGILHTNAQVLYSKGVLNIQNLKDDYCFRWCILGHIYRDVPTSNATMVYHYKKYFNDLVIAGLQFSLKFSDTPNFENLIHPSVSTFSSTKITKFSHSIPLNIATGNIT